MSYYITPSEQKSKKPLNLRQLANVGLGFLLSKGILLHF